MAFTPSPYQQAIFDFLDHQTGSAIVEAVAGSGKTTTILEGLNFVSPAATAQLLAFNKSIADELGRRIQLINYQALQDGQFFPTVSASTFHSATFGAVRSHLAPLNLKVDPHKSRQLCRDPRWLSREDQDLYASYLCKLVGLAKGAGVGTLIPDDDESWAALADHHDLMLDSEEADEDEARNLARELLDRSTKAATTEGLLDFDDQLYLACLWNLKLQPKDLIFVDEAQDTNPVRRAIVRKIASHGGRVIAVGDRNQAIYGFTGASHDALDLIQADFDATALPLSICYRCSQAVVAQAQTLVSAIQAHEDAPHGIVDELGIHAALERLGPTDAILCRNTAPLVGAAYKLLSLGIGCTILGRDLGQGLIGLIQKFRAPSLPILEAQLEAYRQREETKYRAREQWGKAEAVKDRVECIRIIIDHLSPTEQSVGALCDKISRLFTEGGTVLTLSTIHKAKGREWPKVAILRPDLIPSKWARQDWQLQQENNLLYVAWTRAQEELYFLQGELK